MDRISPKLYNEMINEIKRGMTFKFLHRSILVIVDFFTYIWIEMNELYLQVGMIN